MAVHCEFAQKKTFLLHWNASYQTIYNFQVPFNAFLLNRTLCERSIHASIESIHFGIVSGPFMNNRHSALCHFYFCPPFIDRHPFASSNCKIQWLRSSYEAWTTRAMPRTSSTIAKNENVSFVLGKRFLFCAKRKEQKRPLATVPIAIAFNSTLCAEHGKHKFLIIVANSTPKVFNYPATRSRIYAVCATPIAVRTVLFPFSIHFYQFFTIDSSQSAFFCAHGPVHYHLPFTNCDTNMRSNRQVSWAQERSMYRVPAILAIASTRVRRVIKYLIHNIFLFH